VLQCVEAARERVERMRAVEATALLTALRKREQEIQKVGLADSREHFRWARVFPPEHLFEEVSSRVRQGLADGKVSEAIRQP